MSRSKIAGTKPIVLKLESGTYHYCTCGESPDQPFCDGSHKDTGFKPQKLVLTECVRAAYCACKHSKEEPFCDGAHRLYDEGSQL